MGSRAKYASMITKTTKPATALVKRAMEMGELQENLIPPASRRRIVADTEIDRVIMPRKSMRLSLDTVVFSGMENSRPPGRRMPWISLLSLSLLFISS